MHSKSILSVLPMLALTAPVAVANAEYNAHAAVLGSPGGASSTSPVMDAQALNAGSVNPFGAEERGRASASSGRLSGWALGRRVGGSAGTPENMISLASMTFQDLRFEAATDDPVSGSLSLTLDGDYTTNFSVSVTADVNFSGVPLQNGWWSQGSDGSTTSVGLLSGYPGSGPMTIVVPFSNVPVNTDLSLTVGLSVSAGHYTAGTSSVADYSLSFPLPEQESVLFDLPPGVTAQIPSAGVADNLWSAPQDLGLTVAPASTAAGNPIEFTSWNGEPGAPTVLFVTAINEVPVLHYLGLIALLDVDGQWSTGLLPTVPSLAGISVGVTAFSLTSTGFLAASDPASLVLQ